MPKDWASHKAEIKHLYIDEGKTLEEVREILRARYGFIASIRAYRMRVDEWTLRKYKTKRDRSSQPDSMAGLPRSAAAGRSVKPQEKLHFGSELSIPPGPMKAVEVLSLIQGPSASFYTVEILLRKWQTGGEYLRAVTKLLETPEHRKYIMRCTEDYRPLLFQLIEEFVPLEEQLSVGKLLLYADLSMQDLANHPDTEWLDAWQEACGETEWSDVRDALFERNIILRTAGELFLNCARVVVAECLLRENFKRLKALKKEGVLPSSDDPEDPNEAEVCRLNYLEILGEFHHSPLNLRSCFYKHALDILGESSGLANNFSSSDLADHCRHKYVQLESLLEDSVGVFDDFEHTPQCTREGSQESQKSAEDSMSTISNSNITPRVGSPDTQPLQTYQVTVVQTDQPAEVPSALKILLGKWRSLKGFRTYAQSLLIRDGSGISIFEPSNTDNNLFDMITDHISSNDLISFTKALLIAFSTINLDLCYLPYTLTWWVSMYTSSSWPEFQKKLEPKIVDMHLGRLMSPAAIKLVSQVTVLLVGERLLSELNAEIAKHPSRNDTMEDMPNQRLCRQYMAILEEFQARDLKVDLTWRSHALNH